MGLVAGVVAELPDGGVADGLFVVPPDAGLVLPCGWVVAGLVDLVAAGGLLVVLPGEEFVALCCLDEQPASSINRLTKATIANLFIDNAPFFESDGIVGICFRLSSRVQNSHSR